MQSDLQLHVCAQARHTKGVIASSDGRLVLVETVRDLDAVMGRWNDEAVKAVRHTPPAVASFAGVLVSIEGMHAMEGTGTVPRGGLASLTSQRCTTVHGGAGVLANLDALFDAGVRMMGIAHFFDNEVGGSSTGEEQYGLTPLGATPPLAALSSVVPARPRALTCVN